jgi:hypothetical protein
MVDGPRREGPYPDLCGRGGKTAGATRGCWFGLDADIPPVSGSRCHGRDWVLKLLALRQEQFTIKGGARAPLKRLRGGVSPFSICAGTQMLTLT